MLRLSIQILVDIYGRHSQFKYVLYKRCAIKAALATFILDERRFSVLNAINGQAHIAVALT